MTIFIAVWVIFAAFTLALGADNGGYFEPAGIALVLIWPLALAVCLIGLALCFVLYPLLVLWEALNKCI